METIESTKTQSELTQNDRESIAQLHIDYLKARGDPDTQEKAMEKFFSILNSLPETLQDEALIIFT